MKSSRFTLIELLVVIAIISILASMLLPVLSRAKEAGRRTVCTNRLKNLHISTVFYRDDYEYYPMNSGYASSFGPYRSWHHFIKPYTPLENHTGRTNQLGSDRNFLRCPSRGAATWDGDAGTHAEWARSQLLWNAQAWVGGWEFHVGTYYTTVYYGNQDLYDDGSWPWYRACKPKRRTHAKVSPDIRILINEISNDNAGEVVGRNGYTRNPSLTTYPHDMRTNVLLLDGHVQLYDDLYQHVNKDLFFYKDEEVEGD